MASPVQALNENFVYNSMLARALVQLLPANDRASFRSWLDKLVEISSPEKMSVRNEYMWFMLLVLQSNKRLTVPFINLPPEGDLPPLERILPHHIYEDILTSTDQNMAWLDKAGGESEEQIVKRSEPISSAPSKFLDNQPLPKNGIICYMSAFSDHEY